MPRRGKIDLPRNYDNLTIKFMSARKLGHTDILGPVTVHAPATKLDLPASAVRIRKNGIEFRSQTAFAPWTEMTVALEAPGSSTKLQCTGVVVACSGGRHEGYAVSMVFTSLSRQAQARLNSLAYSRLA